MMQPTSKEEQQLWQRWVAERDPRAGDLLIKKYTPLVSYHVHL